MDNDTKSCGNVVEKDGGDIWMEVTQGLNSLEDVIRFLHIGADKALLRGEALIKKVAKALVQRLNVGVQSFDRQPILNDEVAALDKKSVASCGSETI